MQEKLKRTQEVILNALSEGTRPAIAWSGGKDSMAMLHVMLEMGLKFPVIFFREPWQPWKYAFQDMIIRSWGLECYTWHPTRSQFQQTDDEFEVQNFYHFTDGVKTTQLTCPSGITIPEEGKPWACALDMCARPKQGGLQALWDMVFIGHKGCDSDPIYGGDAGTRIDLRIVPNQATMVFPIKEWSHEDVWRYITERDVPWDKDRYEQVDGKWGEKADRLFNCDYVHACFKCVDKRGPNLVDCPKFGCKIENVSDKVEWADQTKPTYMEG